MYNAWTIQKQCTTVGSFMDKILIRRKLSQKRSSVTYNSVEDWSQTIIALQASVSETAEGWSRVHPNRFRGGHKPSSTHR